MQAQPAGPVGVPRCHCVIKLGGSAITVKDRHETLRPDILKSVCSTIKQLHEQLQQLEDKPGVVVVHGAGSFGHFEASQYRVTNLDTPQHTLLEGFAKTRRSVTRLNHLVVSALIDAGLPAVGMSPCGTWFSAHRQLVQDSAGVAAVQALLRHGLVPVLHGDGILDLPEPVGLQQGGQLVPTILSGDTIVRRLTEVLSPVSYAVFLTDVPGLLTRPPAEPGAELLAEVRISAVDGSWKAVTAAAAVTAQAASRENGTTGQQQQQEQQHQQPDLHFTSAEHDTTGGIATKVQEAAVVAQAGCPVIIAQAGTPSGAAAVLYGPSAFSSSHSGSIAGGGGAAACQGTESVGHAVQGTVVRLSDDDA